MQPEGINSNLTQQGVSSQQDSTTTCTQQEKKPKWPTDPTETNISIGFTVGHIDKIELTRTYQTHAQGQMLDKIKRPRGETQWWDLRSTSHTYGRNYERDTGWIIKNIVQ